MEHIFEDEDPARVQCRATNIVEPIHGLGQTTTRVEDYCSRLHIDSSTTNDYMTDIEHPMG